MAALGTLTVTTYRSQPDQNDYQFADNTISSPHLATFRRQVPTPSKDGDKGSVRVNFRVSKAVPINSDGELRELQFNVTGVIPVGANATTVESIYTDELLVAAGSAPVKALMKSADINITD